MVARRNRRERARWRQPGLAVGARRRLSTLTAALALIPLVLAGHKLGNEIESTMAEVILDGLLTSTLLNLVVVPVLFARWGEELGSAVPSEEVR